MYNQEARAGDRRRLMQGLEGGSTGPLTFAPSASRESSAEVPATWWWLRTLVMKSRNSASLPSVAKLFDLPAAAAYRSNSQPSNGRECRACRDRGCFLDRGVCFALERTLRQETYAPYCATCSSVGQFRVRRRAADGALEQPHSGRDGWREQSGSETGALLRELMPAVSPALAKGRHRRRPLPLPVRLSACAPSAL